jgi:hypothetical protein
MLLSSRGTGPDKAALQARKDATNKLPKIELLYNEQDDLVVMDLGGSNMTGMAGLLGPIGLLMAAGIDASSKLSMAERTEKRSKEFTSVVQKNATGGGLNRQFAEQLASRIRAGGREVKVTPTKRAIGALSKMSTPDTQPSPDYAPLVIRITTGYGAKDATSSFQPFIDIGYQLKNAEKIVVYQSSYVKRPDQPSYFTYDALLTQHAAAREGLVLGLAGAVDSVYRGLFEFDL